jgi:hypothetical protein
MQRSFCHGRRARPRHRRDPGAFTKLSLNRKTPNPPPNKLRSPGCAQEIDRRCLASTCASLRAKALPLSFTACLQAGVREGRGMARLFAHEETFANQNDPRVSLQCYSLNHGKLESVMESEKQHGFKCCTFGASSLVDRHLATGDYEVCPVATPPNLAHCFLSCPSAQTHLCNGSLKAPSRSTLLAQRDRLIGSPIIHQSIRRLALGNGPIDGFTTRPCIRLFALGSGPIEGFITYSCTLRLALGSGPIDGFDCCRGGWRFGTWSTWTSPSFR